MPDLIEKETYHWTFSDTTDIQRYIFSTRRGMTILRRGNFSGISATEKQKVP